MFKICIILLEIKIISLLALLKVLITQHFPKFYSVKIFRVDRGLHAVI